MKKVGKRHFALATLAIVSLFLFGPLSAQTVCDSILQYGIFDRVDRLDIRAKANLVKNIHCSSEAKTRESAGGLGFGDMFSASGSDAATESRAFCAASEEFLATNSFYRGVIIKASNIIASTWLQCMESNRQTAAHYLSPTVDPKRIVYKIVYVPGQEKGDPQTTRLRTWHMTGQTRCEGPLPKPKDPIDYSGREILCYRDPKQAIIVTASVVRGGHHLKRVELPPHREDPPRPVIEVAATDYRNGLSQNIAATNAPGNPGWVWGLGVGNGGPPWDMDRYNRAVYLVNTPQAGPYRFEIRYAAAQSRPVQIQVRGPNGGEDQVYPNKLAAPTGGWCLGVVPKSSECRVQNNHLQWGDAGIVNLRTGTNEIWIERGAALPHLKTLRLTYVGK